MKKTLKNKIVRKLIQIAVFGFTNPYFGNFVSGKIYTGKLKSFCTPGLNCYSCPAASFSCPIGAMQAVSGARGHVFSFYAVGMLLAIGAVFGRAVCAFFCPFGLLQELLHKIPVPKLKKLPKWMTYIKYAVLVVLVLLLPLLITAYGVGEPTFCEYVCPAGFIEGALPLVISTPELRDVIGCKFAIKAVMAAATVISALFIYRSFCRILCPLGAIYGLLNRISFFRLHLNEAKCTHCNACKAACKMQVDVLKNPDSPECIRCGECAAACDFGALSMGFTAAKEKD